MYHGIFRLINYMKKLKKLIIMCITAALTFACFPQISGADKMDLMYIKLVVDGQGPVNWLSV